MTDSPVREVGKVDRLAVHAKFRAFTDAQRKVQEQARVGGLVLLFDNDELRYLASTGHLTIADVVTLRRLGLLAPDEGWDGTVHPAPAVEGDR